ncbi:MAG TPA: hypothetical protein VN397_02645 [Candidatus Methylomirabilis sp.]|nr:hypothetical protein [Candidatus Methylomirabilis sp.]
MSPWLKQHEGSIVGLASLAWFAVLTPWGRFADPDAFYHAHVARLMLDWGPLHSFPWLDLTSLGRSFADHHYLFHLILGPAIAALDAFRVANAELWGTQLMAPFLATLAAVCLWTVLRALGVTRAWIWTALALLIPDLSFRLLLAKASPLAVGAFVVVLGAMALRRPMTAFLAGALFALSHGGWVIAIAAAAAMLAGDVIARRFIESDPWIIALRDAPWRAFRALLTGIAFGVLLHPNRLEIIQFLWVQVFKAGLAPSAGIIQGREWLPANLGALFTELAPLVIAGLLGALGLIVSNAVVGSAPDTRQEPAPSETEGMPDNRTFDRMRLSIALALPVALTLALTLKSRRFIEYLVPALVLWLASLWQFVDARRLNNELIGMRNDLSPLGRRIIVPFLSIVGLALMIHHAILPWSSLRQEGAKPFDAYRNTFSAVTERARPGDRVFHSDWDEFPLLFAADDRLRYISGLDPTFLHEASSTLSDQVRDLTVGLATSTAWDVIAERTQSRFVFVTTKRHPDFDAALRADARFRELARNETTAAYEVSR